MRVINIAKAEIGYLEKRSNAQLDDKTANAGNGNYTKYWRDLRPAFQGQAWCQCFADWCLVQAYGKDMALKMLGMTGFGDFYTPDYAENFKKRKAWFTDPAVGDFVYFKNATRIHHVGIVAEVTKGEITTIEGNTSGGSAVIANGGAVCMKTYARTNPNIAGYGRPDYSLIEPMDVTAFVDRMYRYVLGREADAEGRSNWITALNGGMTGGQLAHGFLFSKEFLATPHTVDDLIAILYRAFFDRVPDAGGLDTWRGVLMDAYTAVFDGFANSAEFKALCKTYGIKP